VTWHFNLRTNTWRTNKQSIILTYHSFQVPKKKRYDIKYIFYYGSPRHYMTICYVNTKYLKYSWLPSAETAVNFTLFSFLQRIGQTRRLKAGETNFSLDTIDRSSRTSLWISSRRWLQCSGTFVLPVFNISSIAAMQVVNQEEESKSQSIYHLGTCDRFLKAIKMLLD